MPLLVAETLALASTDSDGYLVLGKTNNGRLLTAIFHLN